MIPTMVQIADDELFSTWLDWVIQMNGVKTAAEQLNFLKNISYSFSKHIKHYIDLSHSMYVSSIENICLTEKDDPIFPKIEDILQKHTDIYAMMPFRSMGETAKRMEYCLHGIGKFRNFYGTYGSDHTIKICPECAKEDEAMYGHQVVHVPHQLAVNVCWKHGCILQYRDTENSVKEQISAHDTDMAILMHDLYENPITTHFQLLIPILKEGFEAKDMFLKDVADYLAENGYITKEQAEKHMLTNKHPASGEDSLKIYTGATSELFHDRNSLAKAIGTWNPESEYTYDDFETLSDSDILMKFRCRKCGHVFYMNPVAAEYGDPCPECACSMSKAEICQRFASRLDDGAYNIYEENGKIHIIHMECGEDLRKRFAHSVWEHQGCSSCGKKHKQGKHIGEKNLDKSGNVMEIVGWHGRRNIDVLLSNGITVKRRYDRFKDGCITAQKDELAKARIGEKKLNNQGFVMELTAYTSCMQCSVRFEDNTTIDGVTYNSFKLGTIAKPGYKKPKHIGETKINAYNNMKMEIIDYKDRKATIKFEDGTILTRNYRQFCKGNIVIKKSEMKQQ